MIEIAIAKLTHLVGGGTSVDWMILYKLRALTEFNYAQIDGSRSPYDAFGTSMGYVTLEEADLNNFEAIVDGATLFLREDLVGLAHLFLIIHRQSINVGLDQARMYKQRMIEKFKTTIGTEQCQALYNLLIEALNKDFNKDSRREYLENPSVAEWLQYFSWGIIRGFNEFGPNKAINLLRNADDYGWQQEWTMPLSPYLRSIVFGSRNPHLYLLPEQALAICQNSELESRFLAALLLWCSNKETAIIVGWADQVLINFWIHHQWQRVGQDLMLFAFGSTNRIRQQQPVIQTLKAQIRAALDGLSDAGLQPLVKDARFPEDFISLLQWMRSGAVEVPASFERAIVNAYLDAVLKLFVKGTENLEGMVAIDPFSFHDIFETKYQTTLLQIGCWMMQYWNNEIEKKIKAWISQIVPFYFGRIRSIHLARNTTELLLINLLSCSATEEHAGLVENIRKFSALITEFLIVPYAHHVEGQDAIWNYKHQDRWLHLSTKFVMAFLHRIQHSEGKHSYEELLTAIGQSKLCPWPFEEADHFFYDETPIS